MIFRIVGRQPGQNLVKKHAQSVDVNLEAVGLRPQNLRRHVLGTPTETHSLAAFVKIHL
jgi:hypothetical protein